MVFFGRFREVHSFMEICVCVCTHTYSHEYIYSHGYINSHGYISLEVVIILKISSDLSLETEALSLYPEFKLPNSNILIIQAFEELVHKIRNDAFLEFGIRTWIAFFSMEKQ